MTVKESVKAEMESALEHLSSELRNVRTGRANPGMVEKVAVEVYGTQMRLVDVANVTAPESQSLLVTPYDANNANVIAKAIQNEAGLPAMADGPVVRVKIPPMDEERRKKMVRECSDLCEQSKVRLRDIRRKFNDQVRKSELGEDERKSEEKIIQTLTDDYCKKADELAAKKEKEVLAV